MQQMSARAPKKCPKCAAVGTVEKQMSAPAFQFRGSGWYVTDYTRKGEQKADAKKADASGGESAPSEAKPKEESKSKPEKPAKTED
jgi:predicted nucleic acid-binding Zn ribbon protein